MRARLDQGHPDVAAGEQAASSTIVPGSGTGEPSGISGYAEITDQHELVLDYELGEHRVS